MPAMSNVRTPIRLLARPMRTFFRGRSYSSKNAFSCCASASDVANLAVDDETAFDRPSRDLDELVRPSLSDMTAAAICEVPILSPTIVLALLPRPRLGALALGVEPLPCGGA